MATPDLIAPPPGSTPVGRAGPRRRRGIPDDLLREASSRLGVLSLLAAVLWVVSLALDHVRSIGKRNAAFEDLLWGMINSAEFLSRR